MARDMDSGARRWLARTAKKNQWRTNAQIDDLIQDGALCWQVILRKYPHVTARPHLMSLFQRTYINHLNKLANKRTSQVPEQPVLEMPDVIDEASELTRFVLEVPTVLRKSLMAILAHPELLARPLRRGPHRQRQLTNDWLCQLAGVDPARYDLHSQLLELLKT